jgi:hypothetical protein
MERKYTEKAARNGAHHAFMICEDEHIGLGPYNASVGDLVCVLHGGDVPFILRQVPAGRYYMMGEACEYQTPPFLIPRSQRADHMPLCLVVDGIMHGEATQMAWRNWNPVETFTLI